MAIEFRQLLNRNCLKLLRFLTKMIKVCVAKQSNYAVDVWRIKKQLKEFLLEKGIVSDSEVSVAIVSGKKMLSLAKKHLNEDSVLHNVLSFPFSETKKEFVNPLTKFNPLGEIVVCYPVAIEEANKEDKLINDKIIELVEHGALHLLGVHHD